MIPYGRQDITAEDIDAVIEVLKSDLITQGSVGPCFEKKILDYCGAEYAVLTSSATAALHIACLSIGLGPGDSLWTSAITFAASANCGLYCGANVDFIDIDSQTYNICPIALELKLQEAKANGILPKVIVVVHMCGHSCDMKAIHALSVKYDFFIIEDASHAIGGEYSNSKIGKGLYSDITIFSFHPVKIITTGEGGCAVTNNHNLAYKMAMYRSHGITRDFDAMVGPADGPWYYEQQLLGFNYRMTEFQAALGLSQIKRLDSYVFERKKIAQFYQETLSGLPINLPFENTLVSSSWHLFVVTLKLDQIHQTRLEIFNYLKDSGIGVNVHYIPVYKHPYFKERFNFNNLKCLNAENYYKSAISLPIYPTLSQDKLNYIADKLNYILRYK